MSTFLLYFFIIVSILIISQFASFFYFFQIINPSQIIKNKHHYNNIIFCKCYAKEKVKHFNDVIAEAFVFGPICISISQHPVARSIGMLLYCDPESSKQIYQLVVDKKI